MSIGERLREERERLGLSQPKFAEVAGTTKQTLFSWESGKTAPDAIQLSALVAIGVDALYILTGEYASEVASLPPDERVLLDSYRRCDAQARQHLIATGALLSAGMAAQALSSAAKKPSAKTAPETA
jgi:transcriptional regulator with XRE-family HTH domain